jgi:cytidylate kinase
MGKQIAIDGPAGAGKSTIAKIVSKKLGFIYVDTGAMYRSAALFFLKKGVDLSDEKVCSGLVDEIDISLKYEDGAQKVILNDEDVTGQIRTEEVSNSASKTAVYPAVRAKLSALQKKIAEENDVVMDGRDIGTVVLPNAFLKIYLTASVECRAERRYKEMLEKGEAPDLETIKEDIRDRDYRDMHRSEAPLKKADDAVEIDSSDMTIDEVADAILNEYKKR